MEKRIKVLANEVNKTFLSVNMNKYYEHTVRVVGYVQTILKYEEDENELVIAAAWIHDIGRTIDNTFKGHMQKLVAAAQPILVQVGYSNSEMHRILEIALQHHPDVKEKITDHYAQMIFDADNLELTGAIGILRWYDTFPSNTQSLISSSKMFLDMYQNAISERGRFFYTEKACMIGEARLIDNVEFCQMVIQEVENIYTFKNFNLAFCKFFSKRKIENSEGRKIIIALAGFRCSGKSFLISLLKKRFAGVISFYNTNSVPTGDGDAQIIGPKEVVTRYGNGESYLWFLRKDLESFYNDSGRIVLIDSIKSESDIKVLKEIFPDALVYTIWLHANYNVREARYVERDLKTRKRSSSLIEHDNELKELGILELMQNADKIIATDCNEIELMHSVSSFLVRFF